MDAKAVAVTGATTGIGFETAAKLHAAGDFVICAGRSPERCAEAKKRLLEIPGGDVEFLRADLSSFESIKSLAADIKALLSEKGFKGLDALVNNAGAVPGRRELTGDGYEMQFMVNYLSAFYLTHLLLPQLKNSGDGRVIVMSSCSHYAGWIHWRDVSLKRFYLSPIAYFQSKLAVVMFANELQRRGVIPAYAADPGLVNTGILDKSGIYSFIWAVLKKRGVPACEGCKTGVYLATAPTKELGRNIYFKDCVPKPPGRRALGEKRCKRLWDMSLKLCGLDVFE